MHTIDLLLINPSLHWKVEQKHILARRVNKDIPNQESPHIGIAYLIAVAKGNGYRVRYLDMAMDGISADEVVNYVGKTQPILVGFTTYTVQIDAAGAVADAIKNKYPGIKTCIGGSHSTAIPIQTLKEFPSFDFIVCGEGEHILHKIMKAIENNTGLPEIKGIVTRNKKESCYSWDHITNLDDLPYPSWEEFNLKNYGGVYPHQTALELPIVTARGCPFHCVFCSRSLGNKVRRRSVENVIGEICRNIDKFGCKSISFLDGTFITDRNWTEEFCSTMIQEELNKKITWSCETRVDSISPELLKRLKEAGCYYIFFGFESGDDEILSLIKKRFKVSQIRKAVQWTKETGIVPVGAFIIGLPGDTEKTVLKAIELGKDLGLFSITFPMAVPFPGTELRSMALRHEHGMRILSNNWSDYGKQDSCILESNELSWSRRKNLQKLAYATHPKKNYNKYLQSLKIAGQGD